MCVKSKTKTMTQCHSYNSFFNTFMCDVNHICHQSNNKNHKQINIKWRPKITYIWSAVESKNESLIHAPREIPKVIRKYGHFGSSLILSKFQAIRFFFGRVVSLNVLKRKLGYCYCYSYYKDESDYIFCVVHFDESFCYQLTCDWGVSNT